MVPRRSEIALRSGREDAGKETIVLAFPAPLAREATTTLRAAGFRFNKLLQHWDGRARLADAEAPHQCRWQRRPSRRHRPYISEEIEGRNRDTKTGIRRDRCTTAADKGDVEMIEDTMEIVRGSSNVFRDVAYPDADVRQAKAMMAAQIIEILDKEQLSTRQAEARTGVAMASPGRLGQEVEVSVTVHPRAQRTAESEAARL